MPTSVWQLPNSGLVVAKLWCGSCQARVWQLPNSSLAAAKLFGSRKTRGLSHGCIHGCVSMDLGTWIYQMEMEPRITTSCMCGEGCATVGTASHPNQCALTWQARSPQGLQQSTAMIWSILTSIQEIYLSMVSWLLRHVCVIWAPWVWKLWRRRSVPRSGVYTVLLLQRGSFIWSCAPS